MVGMGVIVKVMYDPQVTSDAERWLRDVVVHAVEGRRWGVSLRVYLEGTAHPKFVHNARCSDCRVPLEDGEYAFVEMFNGETDFNSWACVDCVYHWLAEHGSIASPPVPGALIRC